jgi:hypothetical protein
MPTIDEVAGLIGPGYAPRALADLQAAARLGIVKTQRTPEGVTVRDATGAHSLARWLTCWTVFDAAREGAME